MREKKLMGFALEEQKRGSSQASGAGRETSYEGEAALFWRHEAESALLQKLMGFALEAQKKVIPSIGARKEKKSHEGDSALF